MNEEFRNKLGIKEDKPNDWFETLYSGSSEKGNGIPWANMAPHPVFKKWIDKTANVNAGKTALVVGCGMGDDAVELEAKGYDVTAFDVAESAVDLCKKRFPSSKVKFMQADLIKGIKDWHKSFDLVLEIFTIQALPPKYEKTVIKNISDFVSPEGQLIVVTELQNRKRIYENGPPWLLNTNYIDHFAENGLKLISCMNNEKPEMGDEIHLSVFKH